MCESTTTDRKVFEKGYSPDHLSSSASSCAISDQLYNQLPTTMASHSYDNDSDWEPESYLRGHATFNDYLGDLSAEDTHVNLVVGGFHFSLPTGVIEKHPDSYFARAIQTSWREADEEPLVINRDGTLFKHIQHYLCNQVMKFWGRSLDWMVDFRQEADYYNLTALVTKCDKEITRYLLHWGLDVIPKQDGLQPVAHRSEVIKVLTSHLLAPFLLGNTDVRGIYPQFFHTLAHHRKTLVAIEKNFTTQERYARDLLSKRRLLYVAPSDIAQIEAVMNSIPLFTHIPTSLSEPQILRVTPETSRSVTFGKRYGHSAGFAYCILQAADRGGSISVTHNGVTQTISRAGEYIVHLVDSVVKIGAVQSGTLILMQCGVTRSNRKVREPTLNERLANEDDTCSIDAGVCDVLLSALHTDLITPAPVEQNTIKRRTVDYLRGLFGRKTHVPLQTEPDSVVSNSVVIPLTRLYPLSGANTKNKCLETDPLVLRGQDADLYVLLCEHFEVSVVTVFYHHNGGECSARVMGPAPIATNTNTTNAAAHGTNTTPANTIQGTNTTPNNTASTSGTTHTPNTTAIIDTTSTSTHDGKVLIVPAPRGYGRNGQIRPYSKKTAQEVPDGVMILTGLHVQMRH